MAIFRLSATVVKRSAGRSAVASAAYRAATQMEDRRTGLTFDYTRKGGVLHTEILAPDNAPDWMRDRTQLWNAVEIAEKRKDAQLAREIQLALPHELSHDERIELLRGFVRAEFVERGMIADVAMHAPDRDGDERNVHAHVMLTMRTIMGDGFGNKCRDWNADFVRAKGDPGFVREAPQLETWRAHWAEHVNRVLAAAGHAERVDHRSLDDQGVDREPEPKLGPVATEMERDGKPSHAGDDRRAAQERNAERARLKEEHAAITAEIIELERERRKRGAMDDIPEDVLAQQWKREASLLEEAKEREEALAGLRQRAELEAAEATRQQEERKKAEEARIANGDISDPKARYADALAKHYDFRQPYAGLANAAMAEYAAFAKQQEAYRKQESAEQDPEKRRLIQLARQIEACDYMGITNERLSGISRAVGRPGADRMAKEEGWKTQSQLYAEQAAKNRDQARELREQRADLMRERTPSEKQKAEASDTLERKVAGRDGEMTDRKAERLGRLQGVGDAYATQNAARTSRPRGGGRSR